MRTGIVFRSSQPRKIATTQKCPAVHAQNTGGHITFGTQQLGLEMLEHRGSWHAIFHESKAFVHALRVNHTLQRLQTRGTNFTLVGNSPIFW